MAIFKCRCGRQKTGQPFNSSSVHPWICSDRPECTGQSEQNLADILNSGRGETVDARDLKSLDSGHAGSSPAVRTKGKRSGGHV